MFEKYLGKSLRGR